MFDFPYQNGKKWYGKKDSILLSISDKSSNMENNIWLVRLSRTSGALWF